MRPYKRATMIARSIIKMIEDSGGGPPDVAAAIVRLRHLQRSEEAVDLRFKPTGLRRQPACGFE